MRSARRLAESIPPTDTFTPTRSRTPPKAAEVVMQLPQCYGYTKGTQNQRHDVCKLRPGNLFSSQSLTPSQLALYHVISLLNSLQSYSRLRSAYLGMD
jgi:hypothetical protein